MQRVLHFSSLQTGVAWMSGSVPSILCAGISQRLVTCRGPRFALVIGTCLIGTGIFWTTKAPVNGRFLASLAGPFVLAGSGTAFSFIPISIAALTGVRQHQTGLASGLMNTSMQLGTALGIALASSVAVSHADALLRIGIAGPAPLDGGCQHALWVLGVIALLALPLTCALLRTPKHAAHIAEAATREAAVPATN